MKVTLSSSLVATIAWCGCFLGVAGSSQKLRLEQNLSDEADNLRIPFQSRIVGGTLADAKKYEYSVNLGGCGGSLIHPDIVLTAAHCRPLYPDEARIGGSNKNNGLKRGIVGYGTPHPQYSSRSQDYDFMVYKLASPATGLSPIPLNTGFDTPVNQEKLTVIGFGSTYEGGPGSYDLRKVDVNKIPHTTCNLNYRGLIEDDIMFCAGVSGGGKDSCQGDSGGPIVDANGVQVGVTSWGNGCAQNGFPGVYARVSAVHDWLREMICELSETPPADCGTPGGDSSSSPGQESSNGNGGGGGAPSNNQDNSHLIQPKGVSLRVDINFDEYPQENAWVLYNDETKEELYWIDFGEITQTGPTSKLFADLSPAKYVFLLLDEFWDGICCDYGNGHVKIYEVYPPESGRNEELRWSHDGEFRNAAGAAFHVDRKRFLQVVAVDADLPAHSRYLP